LIKKSIKYFKLEK